MYTYLLKASNLYKIGKTINLKSRIRTIKTSSPDVELLAFI